MRLAGDPVWLGLVSGSSTGKTETAMALHRLRPVVVASTLSGEAACCPAPPAKDRAEGATGGLLGRVGDHGVLVLKDFTSIISMQRDRRGHILSSLREVFDGAWYRDIGTEGGTRLEWHGKLGVVMASTTAYDRAHAVIAELGDRFVLVRHAAPASSGCAWRAAPSRRSAASSTLPGRSPASASTSCTSKPWTRSPASPAAELARLAGARAAAASAGARSPRPPRRAPSGAPATSWGRVAAPGAFGSGVARQGGHLAVDPGRPPDRAAPVPSPWR